MSLSHSPKIATSGLVLCLDAGNTKSYPGSGTTLADLSGVGNNGTLTNGPTFNSSGGGNISFDGTNDYCSLSGSGINVGVNFTVQVWVRIRRFGGLVGGTTWNRATIISNSYPYSSNQGFFISATSQSASFPFTATPGRETFFISIGNDQFFATASVGSLTSFVNSWVNLSVRVNGATPIKLYINGAEVSSYAGQSNGPSSLSYNGGPCSLAVRNNTEDWSDTSISNFMLFNRALSDGEIAQNFNNLKGRFNL